MTKNRTLVSKKIMPTASSDLNISITSSLSVSLSTGSLSDDTMSFGWHNSFLYSYSNMSMANIWGERESDIKLNLMQKQWYKNETVVQKRNSGTKHTAPFLFRCFI